jgi:CRISPR-associated endonuclease/helicase Cas3
MALWKHQERVSELMSKGKNVILQSPPGSGKTRAAIYPFLKALDTQSNLHTHFPQKCIYSVPMRVLARQFFVEYEKCAGEYERKYGLPPVSVKIQTGEQPNDRFLQGDLIFATIDQTLSSFLLSPYSAPKRMANVNAAALMSSYLVFDEFHLYEPESTLPTTLQMLKMLKGITPFILMTATFSTDMLDELAHLLDAEVVPNSPEEKSWLYELESQQKTRRYHAAAHPLTAQAILDEHNGRSLVICNTIDRAQALYHELCIHKSLQTEVILLHSRFLRDDRNAIEERVREMFKREETQGDYIVVSTQAIEVGVDITSTVLHTELAPANSIIQRAGRCARYQGDEGDVYIYQQSGDVNLLEERAPYTERGQAEQFQSTWEQFVQYSGEALDFGQEQQIVSAVHGVLDRQIIEHLRMNERLHREDMFDIMKGLPDTNASSLVRRVMRQNITIHDKPDELLVSPFDVPSFGFHPGTLQKLVREWLERWNNDDDIPWAVKWLRQIPDPDETNRSSYKWEDIPSGDTAKAARTVWGAPLVVVHPLLATYDKELGFVAQRSDEPEWIAKLPERERREFQPITYRLETYAEHIRRVYEAAFIRSEGERQDGGFWAEIASAASRLEKHFNWQLGGIRRAAELAVLLHDVGKLSVGWQGWVQKYQKSIDMPVEKDEAYAHTELQTEIHKTKEHEAGKRPTHAVESAIAAIHLIIAEFGVEHPLTKAGYSAIARHHAPYSVENLEFRLVKNAAHHIQETLADKNLPLELLLGKNEAIYKNFGSDELIAQPENLSAFLDYLLLIRILRFADQRGTQRGSMEYYP